MTSRAAVIAATVRGEIQRRGALPVEELADALAATDVPLGRKPLDTVRRGLEGDRGLAVDVDGRWHVLAAELEGTVHCVRPTELELREGVLVVRPSLEPVVQLIEDTPWSGRRDRPHLHELADHLELPLPPRYPVAWRRPDRRPAGPQPSDGGDPDWDERDDELESGLVPADPATLLGPTLLAELRAVVDETGAWSRDPDDLTALLWATTAIRVMHGPPGWMPLPGEGQLLGIRVQDGQLRLELVDDARLADPEAIEARKTIVAIADRRLDRQEPWAGRSVVELDEIAMEITLTGSACWRRPVTPLPELLAASGYAVEAGMVMRGRVAGLHPRSDVEDCRARRARLL